MRFVILPLLTLLAAAPVFAQSSRGLDDPSRIAEAIKKEIALIDSDGVVHEGLVVDVGPEGVTMKFESVTRAFALSQIASAERMTDDRADGVAKGILWGLLLSLGNQGSTDSVGVYLLKTMATFGAIGYVLDAAESHREPLYTAPVPTTARATLKPALKLSFRF